MRFKIDINYNFDKDFNIISVRLFPKDDDTSYDSEYVIPFGTTSITALIKAVESRINDCLLDYEKDMEKIIKDLIDRNKPNINEFVDMCGLGCL